ncbi:MULTISPECIES: methyltransferase family protein [Niastella]|uniref:Isoprenylcysteine carboxylmethyltransferase family protein n=1 Tax=Niastella soli TaxID=2821487 RepID=A0ABS3Z058_9BACT|nr:isoprenylcysteine carboxylmethyltransferase family protein [Niastella soli]MBO9202751.1 isoprenylcysteine carboxylmethyltransferase family protein [Niastella soli]
MTFLVNHIILVALWALFGLFHSILAANWWKRLMQQLLVANYKYYSFSYSIFAAVTLVAVLMYQVFLHSHLLYQAPVWVKLFLCLPLLVGIFIMGALIKKYFFSLSGISVFYKMQPPPELVLSGLNRYVRHPLYFGTLLFLWSLFFIYPYVKNLLACVIITLYTVWGARLEEKKLVAQFGEKYTAYKKRVPMLLPRL